MYLGSISGSLLVPAALLVAAAAIEPVPEWGVPVGLIPDCPGLEKNATISDKSMVHLQVLVQKPMLDGKVHRVTVPLKKAAKTILQKKFLNFKNRKTIIYAVGFLDSTLFVWTQALGNVYAKRGYNVIMTDTFKFLTRFYPVSVRFARTIGKKLGEFLVQLREQGLEAENIELAGISLGAHIVGYASKYYYSVTGKKPSRITGLDPAGPCLRYLSSEHKLAPTDAHRVDVLHTNIDGFGTAQPLGHVDFYANGGEYQPNDIPFIPCSSVCSHFRALFYWWQALEHPKKFIAVQCDSVQQARFAQCYNNTQTNYLGLETKFNRPGLYYLPTHNEFPYYRGKAGLKAENEIYTYIIRRLNSGDVVD